MPLPTFITKINWRLILVHFAACWFFNYAFQELYILHDFNIAIPLKFGEPSVGINTGKVLYEYIWIDSSNFTGLTAGLCISLLICIKQRWLWVNSLIAFVAAYFAWRYHVSGWDYLYYPFLLPGRIFSVDNFMRFVIDGGILLSLGLMLFFSNRSVRFINSGAKKG